MSNVTVITHPLVQHKLTLMRKKDASTNSFRRLLGELSTLMAYEVTRDMPLQDVTIETPLETMTAKVIDGKKLVLVSILRAGNGFLDGMLNVVPGARIGHIGLYRDPHTLQPVEYYFKMPSEMAERDVIVVDPMLATGNSAAAAVQRLKELQPRSVKFVCLLAAPEGVATLQAAHPDVPIFTAAIDRELNIHRDASCLSPENWVTKHNRTLYGGQSARCRALGLTPKPCETRTDILKMKHCPESACRPPAPLLPHKPQPMLAHAMHCLSRPGSSCWRWTHPMR